jgi:hypothetical protein
MAWTRIGADSQDEAALDAVFPPPASGSDGPLRLGQQLLIVSIIVTILIGVLVLVAAR